MVKNIKCIFLLCVLMLTGCKHVDNADKEGFKVKTDSAPGFKRQLQEVYHRFPSPEEMLAIINIEDVEFNPQLLNEPEKSREYLDSESQALNLGVYAADIAYLTVFEQYSESIKYFESIYELSDNLRISSAFEEALLKRVQENISNADSLKSISEEAFSSLTNYLEKNENEKIYALISVGGFIEALYLSFDIAGEYKEDNPVVQKIADQKLVLENIIKYLIQYVGDQEMLSKIEGLDEIRDIYDSLGTESGETKVTRTSDGAIVLSGGERLLITKEQYEKLYSTTDKARKEITNNNN